VYKYKSTYSISYAFRREVSTTYTKHQIEIGMIHQFFLLGYR